MPQTAGSLRHPGPGSWFALLALCGLGGCGHSEPFGSRDYGTDQPFDPTPPVQLTFNSGHDRRAAWLPDGSAIFYSTQFAGNTEHDICLAELPGSGGRQRSLTCSLRPGGPDITEALESAAPSPDGRLAYLSASSAIGAKIPAEQALMIGLVADPAAYTQVLSVPYTLPGRRTHSGVSQIHWLDPTHLMYLGEAMNVFQPCDACEDDTLRSGLDAVLLNLDGSGAQPQVIAGTDNASGLSPGSNADEVYYTIGGDTRVYRQTLSTGSVTVVHDFGAAGIARDVDVVGSQLAAVVGGRVHFVEDIQYGTTQYDSGGVVHVVNLSDGSDVRLTSPTDPALFRRPRISPSGAQIVVERYPLQIVETPITVDTSVQRTSDLFLVNRP
jgi:hypothetical protein